MAHELHAIVLASPEGEGPAGHWYDFLPLPVWQTVNLALFLALLWWFLKKPLAKFFADRRTQVAETRRKADEDRRRAEELAAEIDARLARIETELGELRARSAAESASEQDRLRTLAETESQRIAARATAEMEARVREVRQDLTAYAADLAVDIAAGIVKSHVTPADQIRLVSEGVSDLKTAAGRK